MAEEECQKQGPNMAAINISIRHNNDFMIANFFLIHIHIANPCTNGSN